VSVLVVGLSYRSAPLALLERSALAPAQARALETLLRSGEHVAEAVVLSTCNRLEVYADVSKFHAGVFEVGRALASATSVDLGELTDHLYVHYEDAAVAHLFSVTCGLDSMALGEQQILGQVREVLRAAREAGSTGRVLDALLQQALRVGKRAHSETELDRAGHCLVEAGLQQAQHLLGSLDKARVLVVGAGAMSGLAVATAYRRRVRTITVANRDPERAQRLASAVGGQAVASSRLAAALVEADIVLSSTGAFGYVLQAADVAAALRSRAGAEQVYVDLALPRDVAPEVAAIPGAHLLDLEDLGRLLASQGNGVDVAAVRAIVADEVSDYLATQRAMAVAPTVTALRAHARSVVDAELARLVARLPDVDERVREEVAVAVHRVVEKLLHTPTVRVKELAGSPDGVSYAHALRELFDLPDDRYAAVSARAAGMEPERVNVPVEPGIGEAYGSVLGQVGDEL
jgi:glutamyl-tRNA reductase